MKYSSKILAGIMTLFIYISCLQVTVAQSEETVTEAENLAKTEAPAAAKEFRQKSHELKAMAMDKAKKEREALRARLEAIENDASLSADQKEAQITEIKEVAKQKRQEHREAFKGKGKGKHKHADRKKAFENLSKEEKMALKEERKLEKAERKQAFENLSEEEKMALKEERRAKKEEKLAMMKEKINAKKEEFSAAEKSINKKQASQAIGQLDKVEKKLKASYEKGKISEEDYLKRLSKITEVKNRLSNIDSKVPYKK